MRSNEIALIVAGLGILTLAASTVRADDAGPWGEERGFQLGLQYQTSIIGADDPSPSAGPNDIYFDEVGHGGILALGYTFTPEFALRLGMGSARHGTTREGVEALLNTVTIEGHLRFLPEERARPYLLGGFGGAGISVDASGYRSEISGGMATLGAGLLYGATRHLLIDFAARLDFINWQTRKVTFDLPGGAEVKLEDPIDESGSAAKFMLGLSWQF